MSCIYTSSVKYSVFDVLIKCLCTNCGYDFLVMRCCGHELRVNREGSQLIPAANRSSTVKPFHIKYATGPSTDCRTLELCLE